MEIHTEKSVGPPTTRQEPEVETESEMEAEIEFAPMLAASAIGPTKYTIEGPASYSPQAQAQRELAAEAPVGMEVSPQTSSSSVPRTHTELFTLFAHLIALKSMKHS